MKKCLQCDSKWPDDNVNCQACGARLPSIIPVNDRAVDHNDPEGILPEVIDVFSQITPSRGSYASQLQPLAYPQYDANRPVHLTVNNYPSQPNPNSPYEDLAIVVGILGVGIIIGMFMFINAVIFLRWLLLTLPY